MNIKPIRSECDYRRALAEVAQLWGAKAKTPRGDKLEVLITLIAAYEEEHEPILPPDPIEAIRFRMEQEDLKQADLARLLGSRSRASEILSRSRRLSLPMIRKLHQHLGIPAHVLLR